MADLKAAAKAALDYNSTLQEVHVTSDGVPFGLKNDAVNHAVRLQDKEISTFSRGTETESELEEKEVSGQKQYALNVKDTIALIKGATSEEAVLQILADDERKTVQGEAQKQIAILKTNALKDQAAAADAAKVTRENENPNNADQSSQTPSSENE